MPKPEKNPVLAALSLYGEKPIPGPLANPAILNFLGATSYPKGTSDEVPWCSAFLCWIFEQCGINFAANAAAISWLDTGEKVATPLLGDVVVLGWSDSEGTHHHVGLFIREVYNGIYILAGNQNNEVDISLWKKKDVLSYQRFDFPRY